MTSTNFLGFLIPLVSTIFMQPPFLRINIYQGVPKNDGLNSTTKRNMHNLRDSDCPLHVNSLAKHVIFLIFTFPQFMYSTADSLKKKYTWSASSMELTKSGAEKRHSYSTDRAGKKGGNERGQETVPPSIVGILRSRSWA